MQWGKQKLVWIAKSEGIRGEGEGWVNTLVRIK